MLERGRVKQERSTVHTGLAAVVSLGLALVLASPRAAAQQAPNMPPGGDAQKPLFVVNAEKGFLDDPYAIDAGSGELIVLRTDSASFARLEAFDLATGKSKRQVDLGDASPVFERVIPVGGGQGYVIVMRDPTKGTRSAQWHDAQGKPAVLVGPVDDFGLISRSGTPAIIGWQRIRSTSRDGKAGDSAYTVTAYKLEGLAKLGKAVTLNVSRAGDMKDPPIKFLGWQAGYSQIVGQKPGTFDKKRDMRLPDRAVVYDLLAKTFVYEGEITDLVAWAYINELRPKRPGRGLMASLGEGFKTVELVDAMGRRTTLELPVAMAVYDPTSFRDEEDTTGTGLYFSLGVDPLNPAALARQRRDRAFLDVFGASPAQPTKPDAQKAPQYTVTRLLRAALDDRPVGWQVRGQHVAILRKHKSFSRGGTALEVYALAP